MEKTKSKKSDIKILHISEGLNASWAFGVPKKGSVEYGIEYLYFEFKYKDKRRHGLGIYIDKSEIQLFKKAFRLVDKYYKK